MNWVYNIKINDVVRYVGITTDIKRRQRQHNYLFKKGEMKELYHNIRLINPNQEIVLEVLYEFTTKIEAERMECFLILHDWFSNRNLWQSPPSSVKYHQNKKY